MDVANYDGLRSFIKRCQDLGEIRVVEGVDWDRELSALVEAASERIDEPPAIMFDRIKDYPAGHRVLSMAITSTRRSAVALGLSPEISKLELLRQGTQKVLNARPVKPRVVKDGPVMQNTMTGNAVNMQRFPVPVYHKHDGGRYIGTGDSVFHRDPETGFVNMATYRIQLHDENTLGLWMSPGQQGRVISEAYWRQGKAAPVVVTFGTDPIVWMPGNTKVPYGTSELEIAGGLRGEPVEVIEGPLTGLPFPAHAEIAVEGEIPPPEEEMRDEGPFGEWPGYYSGGTIGTGRPQLVIRVKACYWRNDPIIVDMAPHWPGCAPQMGFRFDAGMLTHQLEQAGVPGVIGSFVYYPHFIVVAIQQKYAGHARQTGMAVLGCSAAARNGRYVVVVDEDIDPCNIHEVMWAMNTRVDPKSDIQIVEGAWASPLDPRMSPDQKRDGPSTNSRAIIYAVRPYHWKDKFPISSRFDRETIQAVADKYADQLPFRRN